MKDEKTVLEEIRKEFQVVSARAFKLRNFMVSEEYGNMSFYMKDAFKTQLDGMDGYCEGLYRRIQHMMNEGSCSVKPADDGFLL